MSVLSKVRELIQDEPSQKPENSFTRKELQEELQISEYRARKVIQKLIAEGKIRPVNYGTAIGHGVAYVLQEGSETSSTQEIKPHHAPGDRQAIAVIPGTRTRRK